MTSCDDAMKLEALPKGFRFRPMDEELVNYYLRLKINGHHSAVEVIPEIDVCKWEPWDLPALSVIKSEDPEWFFFCPRDKKYPNGYRSNRATGAGYWKATGKDRTIKSRKTSPSGRSHAHAIGLKKTLVFYRDRAPRGERTNWIIHEYCATEPDLDGTGSGQVDYVLCRLFRKADERLDNLKCNEVEHTSSVPSTDKSSPDDASSDVFCEPAMFDMKMVKEPEDVKNWWIDQGHQADCPTPTNRATIESSTSDGIDHSREEPAVEVSLRPQDNLMSEEAPYNQFDNVLGALQSHNYADLGAPIGSPFVADFGYERNGLHFQDGTSEPDASLSELLEDLQNLQNRGHCFYQDSTSHKTYDGSCESFIPGHIEDLKQAPFAICQVSETGIKIRSRQPRKTPSSMNFTPQGAAPRRIRLCLGPEPDSDTSKEDESQSLSTQATQDSDTTPSEQPEFLDENAENSEKIAPKLPSKYEQNDSLRMPSFAISARLPVCRSSGTMKAYAVGVYAAIVVSVFLGIWICPKLQGLHV